MKPSLCNLIPSLPLFCQLPTPGFDSILILAAWDPRCIASGRTHRKHCCLYCCMLIHCCRVCLPHRCIATSAAQPHRECRLQNLFYFYVTSQRTWRVPLLRVYNGCSSTSAVLTSTKYATIWIALTFDQGRLAYRHCGTAASPIVTWHYR
jgi:hypothetical protein